ncbi:MAG: ABC transporter ATP-binding protein [Alphaproteobacteria bacterium]|nr:ABC transporter ATP-binding protein [Alphaproteobacteria bacterium]
MTAQPFEKTALKYILKDCILPFKWAFFFCLLLVFTESAVYNALNWLFAQLVDCIKAGQTPQVLHRAFWIIGIIILCHIINIFLPKQVLMFRQKRLYFPIQEKIYGRALAYIFAHSVNYIINKQTGTLLAKTNQINNQQAVVSMLINGFWAVITDIGLTIILLATINIWLALLFVGFAILVALVNYLANKASSRLSKMESKSFSLYNGWLVDAISNIRLVKQYNRLAYEKKRLSTLLAQYIRIKAKTTLVWFVSYTGVGAVVHMSSILLLAFSVFLFASSKISIGNIVFVLLTLNTGFMWLMDLCVLYRHFENNLSYTQAGLAPFNDKHDIVDMPSAKTLHARRGAIEFIDVSFAYPHHKKMFNHFNLTIKPHEKLGIVGLSGNGKTTLINLLQRAYDISGGTILIDNQDIKTVTQQSLHQNLAVILQDTVLFHRSVAENIAYGRQNASFKSIKQAAVQASADEFIEALPEGYQSKVGERGCKLSGGEKQRIAIARAILQNAPILILDEATSSLDSRSEAKVADALHQLMKNHTVIAIAHRLSTLKQMDRIVYLEHGQIVESGTFDELKNIKNGKFATLWKLQQLEKEK